jgi:very-short-patch-repair endonuclease
MRHEGKLAFRRALRATLTAAERILWAHLRRRQLHGFKFRRQHPVGNYVLDFYCSQRKLAIEVDGDSHYVDQGPVRDEGRSAVLAREGIRVLRFTNVELMAELEGVIETITAELGAPPPDLPRRSAPGEETR